MSPRVQQASSPAQPDPIRIPKAEDPDVFGAMKRRFENQQTNKNGRESTRLTDGGYSRTTLG